MVNHCKGCGEDLTNLYPALSRYGHGDLCSDCGMLEAFNGDFIKKYAGTSPFDYPAAMLRQKTEDNKKWRETMGQ